jgi:hypothetical protein
MTDISKNINNQHLKGQKVNKPKDKEGKASHQEQPDQMETASVASSNANTQLDGKTVLNHLAKTSQLQQAALQQEGSTAIALQGFGKLLGKVEGVISEDFPKLSEKAQRRLALIVINKMLEKQEIA